MDETGRYTAVFDPLDGSSNVDAGIPTGTIFGIFESGDALCILPEEGCEEPPTEADKGCEVESEATEQCLAATLQPGTSLVASGYCLYSSSCFFALTLGAGVQIFALDSMIGEFVLTHANVKLPTRGSIYSMNEVSLVVVVVVVVVVILILGHCVWMRAPHSVLLYPQANRQQWDEPLRQYVSEIQTGKGESGAKYTSRYACREVIEGSVDARQSTRRHHRRTAPPWHAGTSAPWWATCTARCCTAASSPTPPTRRTQMAS